MRINLFTGLFLLVILNTSLLQAGTQAHPVVAKTQSIEQQIALMDQKIQGMEKLLSLSRIQDEEAISSVFREEWVRLTCQRERLDVQQLAGNIATKDLLDKVEQKCQAAKTKEASTRFSFGVNQKPLISNTQGASHSNPNQPVAKEVKIDSALTPEAEAKRRAAAVFFLDDDNIVLRRDRPGDTAPCEKDDKLCVTLDWSQKSPTVMPLRKSGDVHFYAVNLNDILYEYSMTGEAPKPTSDDLSLFADLIKTTQNTFLPHTDSGAGLKTTDFANKMIATPCDLDDDLARAKAQVDKLDSALTGLVPTATDKKYESIPLATTKVQFRKLVSAFEDFVPSVAKLKKSLNRSDLGSECASQIGTASTLITEQTPKIRHDVERLRDRYNGPHSLDQEFHCEQTIGCSMSVLESYHGTPTTASPNPWKSTLQATLSQLTLSGGFLLTTLQARTYSSRTAPDPSAPTTKTVNVLGVDYGSGYRPALTALFNYHLPIPHTDWPNGGFALSAGPVIDVSSGKADTSVFGFFGGVSAHLWNRFWLTPGIHVGQFADTPLGFKGPGDIIPANSGTPTPVKRYSARFAFAVTFEGGNPAGLIGEKKADKPAPSPGDNPAKPAKP